MSKVHIVGAGPAGSIAAISALRSGHDVVVSEEHNASGIPQNCSGLFSKDGLESLSSFVDYKKFILNPIYGADIYFVDEKLEVRRDRPVGFVCDRSAFDCALAQRADSEGAKINYNDQVKDTFYSNNIIGADGPLSVVAKNFSFKKIERYASTLRALINFRCENSRIVEVFLSNKSPGFFGWLIPHDEYTAEIGVGVEIPNRIDEAWSHLLRLKEIKCDPKPIGAIIPLETRSRTARRIGKKNILLAGDAAGQVKATTGGGVIFGGNCANLAGRFAEDPRRYELEWRLAHGLDLVLHKAVHDYIISMHDHEICALGKKLKRLKCDAYLSQHGHMDRPTKMINPHMLIHPLLAIAGIK